MNKARRNAIDDVISDIEEMKSLYDEIIEKLTIIRDDETDFMDNIPENLQSSERYYNAEEAVDNLESALSDLEDIEFDDIIDCLEEAKGV